MRPKKKSLLQPPKMKATDLAPLSVASSKHVTWKSMAAKSLRSKAISSKRCV